MTLRLLRREAKQLIQGPGTKLEARRLATEAASKMKLLPKDEKSPLADNAGPDDLSFWVAYKEAKALIQFEPVSPAHNGK